jgi:hypothetical protein
MEMMGPTTTVDLADLVEIMEVQAITMETTMMNSIQKIIRRNLTWVMFLL